MHPVLRIFIGTFDFKQVLSHYCQNLLNITKFHLLSITPPQLLVKPNDWFYAFHFWIKLVNKVWYLVENVITCQTFLFRTYFWFFEAISNSYHETFFHKYKHCNGNALKYRLSSLIASTSIENVSAKKRQFMISFKSDVKSEYKVLFLHQILTFWN